MAVWHDVLGWAISEYYGFYLTALDLSVGNIVETDVDFGKAEEIEVSSIDVFQVD